MSDGRKHAVIEAGGEVYNLRVSYNAICDIIDMMGPIDLKKINLSVARAVVWAGVNNYGTKTITIKQAGDICEAIIKEKGFGGLKIALERLIDESDWLKDKKGEDTGNPDPRIPAAQKTLSGTTGASPMG